MSTSAFNLFMENFPFILFCDSFQKALSRVLEAPDPESNEDAANCHRLRDLFFSKKKKFSGLLYSHYCH